MSQTSENRWKPVNPSSTNPRWEPNKNEGNPNYPTACEGYFKSLTPRVGPRGEFLVAVISVMKDGVLNDVDVSGGKVLTDRLQNTPLNSYVRIEYKGKVPSKSGGSYNMFDVFVDPGAVPLDKLPKQTVVAPATPAAPAPVFTPQTAGVSAPPTQPAQPVAQRPFTPSSASASQAPANPWTPSSPANPFAARNAAAAAAAWTPENDDLPF
jgi:hypothetical protein